MEKAIDICHGAEVTAVQLSKIGADVEVMSKISCPGKSGKKHMHADKPREKVEHRKTCKFCGLEH